MDKDSDIDLTSLIKAVESFNRRVNLYKKPRDWTEEEDEAICAGLIQSFEYTYEICWKYMKRWIEHNINRDIVTGVPMIELYRRSAESALIDEIS